MDNYNLIFVDCEGHGPTLTLNDDNKVEFEAVDYHSKQSFHGQSGTKKTFERFFKWLGQFQSKVVFISDNPAYDWQFINCYFHKFWGELKQLEKERKEINKKVNYFLKKLGY